MQVYELKSDDQSVSHCQMILRVNKLKSNDW